MGKHMVASGDLLEQHARYREQARTECDTVPQESLGRAQPPRGDIPEAQAQRDRPGETQEHPEARETIRDHRRPPSERLDRIMASPRALVAMPQASVMSSCTSTQGAIGFP